MISSTIDQASAQSTLVDSRAAIARVCWTGMSMRRCAQYCVRHSLGGHPAGVGCEAQGKGVLK